MTDAIQIAETGIAAAIAAGYQIAAADVLEIQGVPALRVPCEYNLELMPELLPKPLRTRARMQALTVAGFCGYVKRYATMQTALFHSVAEAKLTAILDYHEQGKPEWCEHSAILDMKESEQWAAWAGMKTPPLSQVEFAEFIEQNAGDISSPPVASILEAVLNFRQTTQVTFSSVKRLDNGMTQLVYSEQEKGASTVQLPGEIVLGIPVFEGGAVYGINALLRYRVREGNLRLWFEIAQEDKVKRQAVADVIEAVKRELPDLPTFAGFAHAL